MNELKKIGNALISVYDKTGLDVLAKKLNEHGIKIFSTGGTQKYIADLGIEVTAVESITGYPEILGGRVKTLHPAVFGGILARRNVEHDLHELNEHNIPLFDLIIVDLYPFENTVKSGAAEKEVIEKIDIGGVSLIRAAAKNFYDTTIITSHEDYAFLCNLLDEKNGTEIEDRKKLCANAFYTTARYDGLIMKYFSGESNEYFSEIYNEGKILRYGENPHQKGVFYGKYSEIFTILSGKELSYNNLLDLDGALSLLYEFSNPACVIIKHTNPCGAAEKDTIYNAWKTALAADPVSAFGGIIACNKTLDLQTAKEIDEIFYEIIIAPNYESEALQILTSKKNRIVLQLNNKYQPENRIRTALNGILFQQNDAEISSSEKWNYITERKPSSDEKSNLLFAEKVVKHARSNAIVIVKNNQLIGLGCGLPSRVDALKHAIQKAKELGHNLENSVLASDAFFPFADCVEIANAEKISAVIQPGGSMKDQLSVDVCNKHGMAMVFTGTRHFKH